MGSSNTIIILTDVFEHRKRKQKELEFYMKKKAELETKLGYIRQEINLTDYVIRLIKKEAIEEIKK